ncbi:hypothetical protein ACTHGU_21740 [Chitinophagaceae bacterium MMS25-I14]
MKKKRHKVSHKINLMDILPFEELYSWQQDKLSFRFPRLDNGEMDVSFATPQQKLEYTSLDITDILGDMAIALHELLSVPHIYTTENGFRSSDYMRLVLHDTENGMYAWCLVYSEHLLQVAVWKTFNIDFLEDLVEVHFDTAKYEELQKRPAKDLRNGLKITVAMRPDLFVKAFIDGVSELKISNTSRDFMENWAFPFPDEEVNMLKEWLENWQPE